MTINHTSTETLYSGLGDARSITVDWINDRVYWVEYVGGASSQVCLFRVILQFYVKLIRAKILLIPTCKMLLHVYSECLMIHVSMYFLCS